MRAELDPRREANRLDGGVARRGDTAGAGPAFAARALGGPAFGERVRAELAGGDGAAAGGAAVARRREVRGLGVTVPAAEPAGAGDTGSRAGATTGSGSAGSSIVAPDEGGKRAGEADLGAARSGMTERRNGPSGPSCCSSRCTAKPPRKRARATWLRPRFTNSGR